MNGKLSLQDLADILSQKANISKKEAELFFKELFQIILDRIYENDTVKIKDFGTFKLTAISSRESVDVNTGQKIEIPAHYRFTFSPDKVLKEIVNEPFSNFQTVLLEDGVEPSDIEFDILQQLDGEDVITDNDVSKVIQEQVKQLEELKQTKYTNLSDEVVVSKAQEISLEEESTSISVSEISDSIVYSDIKFDEGQSQEDVISLSASKLEEETITAQHDVPIYIKESNESPVDADDLVSQSIGTSFAYDDGIDDDVAENSIDLDTTFLTSEENVESVDNQEFQESNTIQEEQNQSSYSAENELSEGVLMSSSEESSDRPLVPDSVVSHQLEQAKPLVENFDTPLHVEEEVKQSSPDDSDVNQEFYRGEDDWNKASRLRSRILIVVLGVLVAIFVVREFINLFDVKPDYEKYIGLSTENLVMEDTMPYLLDGDDMSISLDIASGEQSGSASSTKADSVIVSADVMVRSVASHSDNSIVKSKQAIPVDEALATDSNLIDKVALSKAKRLSRKVSDNLSVSNVNKAQWFVANSLEVNQGQEKTLPVAEKKVKDKVEKVTKPVSDKKVVAVEKQIVKESAVSKEVKKDPVVKMDRGMTLRSLSTKYYGNAIYWVYIYSANKEKLPKPDNVPVGLVLTIPSLTQYGVTSPTDIKQIEKAKQMESQILKR